MAKKKNPASDDEFLEAGIAEEDGGDRWLQSGDLAKAVRFYMRAWTLYEKAIQMTTEASVRYDARFNMVRMQYVVYTGLVVTGKLSRVPETTLDAPGSQVVQNDIGAIVAAHNDLIQTVSGEPPIDLMYNYAQALAQAGTDLQSAQTLAQADHVFAGVLERQWTQLNEGQEIGEVQEEQEKEDEKGQKQDIEPEEPEEQGSTNFGPAATVETLVPYLDNITEQLDLGVDRRERGQQLVALLDQVVARFRSGLSSKLVNEARIAVAKLQSAVCGYNEPQLESIWAADWLPSTSDRYFAQADAFLDTPEPAQQWKAYSVAGKSLQEAVTQAKSEHRPVAEQKAWLTLGQVELQRAALDDAVAVRNRAVLVKNAATYFRNCVNVQIPSPTDESEAQREEARQGIERATGASES